MVYIYSGFALCELSFPDVVWSIYIERANGGYKKYVGCPSEWYHTLAIAEIMDNIIGKIEIYPENYEIYIYDVMDVKKEEALIPKSIEKTYYVLGVVTVKYSLSPGNTAVPEKYSTWNARLIFSIENMHLWDIFLENDSSSIFIMHEDEIKNHGIVSITKYKHIDQWKIRKFISSFVSILGKIAIEEDEEKEEIQTILKNISEIGQL